MLQKYSPLWWSNSPNFIALFDQMKPPCAIYVLHSRQGQSLGDQDLVKCVNLVNDPQCFI